jgi:pimeloyl-ACP methyl ester carboxylesterase
VPADTLHVEQLAPSRTVAAGTATAAPSVEAPLVVLVHGSMDRLRSFAKLASRLSDCCVVGYDRRGYARSRSANPAAQSLLDHADDLISVLDERPALVLGHSYGADVVLCAAQARPDLVQSAVVYEPPLPWFDWWHTERPSHFRFWLDGADPGEAAEGFVAQMVGPDRYARMPERFRAELRKDGPAFVTEMKALREDPPPFDPANIPVRVLVVRGSESAERHARGTAYLVSELPDGELAILEGAGHGGHLSHPGLLADLVHAELARRPANRDAG